MKSFNLALVAALGAFGADATLNTTIMLDDGEGHAVEMPRIAAGTWQYEYRNPSPDFTKFYTHVWSCNLVAS